MDILVYMFLVSLLALGIVWVIGKMYSFSTLPDTDDRDHDADAGANPDAND